MYNETDISRTIREKYNTMPKNFQRVASYIIDHYDEIVYLSVSELAKAIGVSNTMIIRFSKHLGFAGYSELRTQFKNEAYNKSIFTPLSNIEKSPSRRRYAQEYMQTAASNLQHFANSIDYGLVDIAVTKLIEAEHIYVGGLGLDESVALFLYNNLSRMGFCVTVLNSEGHALRSKLCKIGERDVLIMSSSLIAWQDEKVMARITKEHGATLITIAGSKSNAMMLGGDYNFIIPVNPNIFFTSYAIQMVLCDLLLIKIHERIPDQIDANLRNYYALTSSEDENV